MATNYVIRKSGGQIIVLGGNTNTTDTVLSIPGIGVPILADPLYQDLVTILENSANYVGTGPTPAITGQLWYDVNSQSLKVYSGTNWKPVGTGFTYTDTGNGISLVSSLGQNASGQTSINFRTINGDNTTIGITTLGNTLTVSSLISPTNVGTGVGNVYKDGWGFRRIKSGDAKMVVSQQGDDIVITTLAIGASDIGGFISDGRNVPDGGDGVAVYLNNSGTSMLFRKLKGVRDIVGGVAGPGISCTVDAQNQILITAQSLLKVGEAEINHAVSVPTASTGVEVYAGMQDTNLMIKKIKRIGAIVVTDVSNEIQISFDSSKLASISSYCSGGTTSPTGQLIASTNPSVYGPVLPASAVSSSNVAASSVNVDNATNFTTTPSSMAKLIVPSSTSARTDYITAHCLQVCDYGLINGASSHVILQVNGKTVYDEQRWCGNDTNIYYTYNATNGESITYELFCNVDQTDYNNSPNQAGVQFRQINIIAFSIGA